MALSRQAIGFDLELDAVPTPGGMRLDLKYNTALFRADTAAAMLNRLETLIASACAQPDDSVMRLPMLTDADRRGLLDWSTGPRVETARAPDPRDFLVPGWFERQALATPDAVAVICGAARLTYAELDRRANRLAHHLASFGVGPDVLVGVVVDRSLEMTTTLLAILKAGGAYVPLDPALPSERLALMIEDSGLGVIVTRGPIDGVLPRKGATVIDLNQDAAAIAGQRSDAPPVRALRPEHLAYLLFTSGSTGRPKGVEIPHSALANLLASTQREPGFAAGDTLLAITTLSFDIAGLELFLPLVSGGTVVLATREDARDPKRLIHLLREHRCTVLQATPATWRTMIDAGWAGSPSLTALCGGEALPGDLAEALRPRCRELWNMYGPTETTIWSTCGRVGSSDRIDIGRPLANTDVLVLDPHRQLVPPGVEGELHIGGAGLARGYHDRADLTADRFVPHPFRAGERLYATGDRARWRSDGRLEWLGRTDDQVKIRGYRVELGEVEATLRAHPRVGDAVVLLREDVPGDRRLVAYVTGDASPPDLRAFAASRLPDYEVPAVFVRIETLPLLPGGKVNRRALPAPSPERSPDPAFVGPRTPIESRLAGIWQQVLGVAQVGAADDFFLLGGHSLLALALLQRVQQEFGVALAPAAIFRAPTLEAQAAQIERAGEAGSPGSRDELRALVPLASGGSGAPFFWLHGIGGEVFSYVPVSRYLGASRPVFGFAADWTRLLGDEPLTLERVAARLVAELRLAHPAGPYHLGGFCSAALLALEMARQLDAAGEDVGVVAVLDYDMGRTERSPSGLGAALAFARNLPNWIRDDAIPSGVRNLVGRVRSRLRSVRQRGDASETDIRDRLGMWHFPDHQVPMLTAHFDVLQSHSPKPWHGRVSMFLPRTCPLLGPWPKGRSEDWDRLAGQGVDVHRVAGSHSTMLTEPFARELAARLDAAIERTDA